MGAAAKQAMFDRAMVARHDQAADERTAGLPVGALGSDVLFDLATDEDANGLQVLECCAKAVADKYSLTILEAVDLIELIAPSDFDTARTLAEAN